MAGLIVRADAGFEALLGGVLILAGATGALAANDFPHPVGQPLIVAAGAALLGVAVYLWRADESALRVLAIGNAVTACLAVAWLALASGFSPTGAALVGATVGVLASLAFAQAVARHLTGRAAA